MNASADTDTRRDADTPWDVVVVGGGAAGLNAALVLARARRRVVVIDAGEPRNRFAGHLHGFLSRDGISPLELLELGRAEVLGYGATIVAGRVVTVTRTEDGDEDGAVDGSAPVGPAASARFTATLDDGRIVTGRRLLVATGLRDELPDIPGLAAQWGRGAVACPYCDGWESRDKRIGVIASSPMNAHQAGLLRQWSADVTLIGSAARDLDPEVRAGFAARGVAVDERAVTEVLSAEGGMLVGVRLDDGGIREFDVLFTGGRMVPNDELLRQLGAATEPMPVVGEWVASDPTGLTSVPGVWVAGNAAAFSALVVVAAAQGLMAATAINADLVGEDTRIAIAG